MSSLLRHFLVSTTAAILVVIVYHFFAFTKEIIITQPATPLINTSNTNPIVVRNAAENTDFTIAVEKTIDAVVHITNTSKNKYQHYNFYKVIPSYWNGFRSHRIP